MLVLVLVAFAAVAAVIDVRSRRIPNVLTGALALSGLAIHLTQGAVPTLIALATMLAAFVLGTLAFQAGWFGGGDVKLIAGACGLVSYPDCLPLLAYILAAGAALALASAAREGRLVELIRSTAIIAAHGGGPSRRSPLPYGVAIAAGSAGYALATFLPLTWTTP
ncbi:MAG: prepilin peptidase [Candidatus Eremiobacteraeota bacterium]|nr:prepilin peptidase [Candidatus Eremiobacteraeota bacterium]MBV8644309.1 prepilin peptidase [Candidatus Eremiobacteraeota bacterium]